MKKLALLVLFAALASAAQYEGPKKVYILPMAGGLDQYLAQWLTKDQALEVTADPKAAEVIMTDHLGESFEQKLKEIRPADDKKKADDNAPNAFRATRPRGTIFLVDAKSRTVLWSDYEKPRSTSDRDLNRAAEKIAKALSAK